MKAQLRNPVHVHRRGAAFLVLYAAAGIAGCDAPPEARAAPPARLGVTLTNGSGGNGEGNAPQGQHRHEDVGGAGAAGPEDVGRRPR